MYNCTTNIQFVDVTKSIEEGRISIDCDIAASQVHSVESEESVYLIRLTEEESDKTLDLERFSFPDYEVEKVKASGYFSRKRWFTFSFPDIPGCDTSNPVYALELLKLSNEKSTKYTIVDIVHLNRIN